MNAERREQYIDFICVRLCRATRQLEMLREPLTAHLGNMDDETIFTVVELAHLCPENVKFSDDAGELISLIFDENSDDIRFFGKHLQDFKDREISLQNFSLLLSTLRYLEMVGEGEDYPYMESHYRLMHVYSERVPYHHNDELVTLVHEHADRSDEIVDLMYREGIRDPGLIREHMRNAAPALKDGLL